MEGGEPLDVAVGDLVRAGPCAHAPTLPRRAWHDPGVTRLAGAHVLITGGSSGIGLALAEHCARVGAAVSLVARDPERLDAARAR
ncbi:MAG: SDR family NAD(P)-dependent oxidoreductase, partial [Actinobacteria bacterium]|nr:SDR family NAD(P)-dependent oxidoreductase [Actinomycetota bacterium]